MALKVVGLKQKLSAEVTIFLVLKGVRLAEKQQTVDFKWGQVDVIR